MYLAHPHVGIGEAASGSEAVFAVLALFYVVVALVLWREIRRGGRF